MPVIHMTTSTLSPEIKKELIAGITKLTSEITGTPEQFFTFVITEHDDENLGVGGETVADFKARIQSNNNKR